MTDLDAPSPQARRQDWLAVLAHAPRASLAQCAAAIDWTALAWLREPEFGLAMLRGRIGGFGDKILPEEITPTVCYLAHEDCPVTGEVYSVAGGSVSRFFIGRTPGYFNADLTVEDVRDNLGQIRAEEGYTVPHGISEELGLLLEVFKNNA